MPADSKLFEHLNFLIVTRCEQLESAKSIIAILKRNSCQICSIYKCTNSTIPKDDLKLWFIDDVAEGNVIHFIISEDINFPFYGLASIDLLIPVVTPDWIYNSIETEKHARTSLFSPDPKHIFKQFQVYVSRHSFNNSEYLFYTEMVHALGGTCVDFLSNKTTHLVTNDPRDPGISAVINFGKVDPMKFVYPTWIVECFKKIFLASESMHKISPEDSNSSSRRKLDDLWGQVNEIDFKLASNIWKQHSFIIGMDISLNRELYCTLIEFLQANGGTVHRHLDESDIAKTNADCYIGKLISSKEYEVAENKKLHLGNLIWIFYMWSLEEFVVPTDKLLFSPFKRKLVETSQLVTAYTNFFGQQRFYIQRLVNALGGFTTPDFSRRNTHLVCRFPFGKKFETAKKWQDKCMITNHLWLEECYRQSTRLDPSEPPFQEIPVSGGFRRTLGQMQWDNPEFCNAGDFGNQLGVDNLDTQETPLMPQRPEGDITIRKVEQQTTEQLPTNLELVEETTITDEQEESKVNVGKLGTTSGLILEPKLVGIGGPIQSDKRDQEQKSTERMLDCKEVDLEDIYEAEQNEPCINISNVRKTPSEIQNLEQKQPSDPSHGEPNHLFDLGITHKERNETTKKKSWTFQEEGKAGVVSQNKEYQVIRNETIENDEAKEQISEEAEKRSASVIKNLKEDKSPVKREVSMNRLENSDGSPYGQYEQSKEKHGMVMQNHNRENNNHVDTARQLPAEYPEKSLIFLKQTDEDVSQPGNDAIDSLPLKSPVCGSHREVTLQTPPSESTPASIVHLPSSQGSRRAAKDKAARRLHDDIESLNEFQRNSKKKKTGNLLPEEISLLEKRRSLEIKAKEILMDLRLGENENIGDDAESCCIQNRLPKKLYHINALLTGLSDNIDDLDLTILKLLGITIHKEITSENFEKLDAIIAPKKLRTAKFLKSLSFHPLRYTLTPKFLKDILKMVHKRKKTNLDVNISSYCIPDTDHKKLFELTSLPDKVFERAGILKVNIVSDISGGIDTICSILRAHGVAETKSIHTTHMNKLSIQDFLLNDTNVKHRTDPPWEYIFLVNKPAQVRIFKKLTKAGNNSAIAVAWDWFVTSIFQLEVDINSPHHVVYRAGGYRD